VDTESGKDTSETCGYPDVRERRQVKIAICAGISPTAVDPKDSGGYTRSGCHSLRRADNSRQEINELM
jgi:hypothetical protein